jgi:Universal stress protein UspA and related nucleotide-binding proteins
MKTILIATDFSSSSQNASLYGLQLSKTIGANIILFHAYEVPSPASGLGITISRYSVMMETDKRLLEEAEILDPKRSIIEIACDEGVAVDAIMKIAKEKKADLIITGMKGSGRIFKKLLGSTANLLAKKTSIPLIIVPEDAKFTTPGTIVFASDELNTDKRIPEELILFAQHFNSKLYVLNVVKNKKGEAYDVEHDNQMAKKIIQVFDISFQYAVDTDIRHALNKFIEKHNADMLVMTPHKHEWIERLYKKSQTADMIFHTKIPLLVLPEIKEEVKKGKKQLAKASVD